MARPCPSCGTRKNMHFIGHNAGFRQVMEANDLKMIHHRCKRCGYTEWTIKEKRRRRKHEPRTKPGKGR